MISMVAESLALLEAKQMPWLSAVSDLLTVPVKAGTICRNILSHNIIIQTLQGSHSSQSHALPPLPINFCRCPT